MSTTPRGVRNSIQYLQAEYDRGNKKPLEDVVRAWKGIKELPPTNPLSFFVIGGYHGEPFTLRPGVDALGPTDTYMYWGGWCNHGNVLFPLWHRAYVWRLEQALQSIVPGVMMPFWDETTADSVLGGIPSVLTAEKFELDGVLIDNPLKSFVLPASLADEYPGDDNTYTKPAGYETVRYPLSGLVGTPADKKTTDAHNAKFTDPAKRTQLLNQNVAQWLQGAGEDDLKTAPFGPPGPTSTTPHPKKNGVYDLFVRCLEAPNYTVFSNTTSAGAWNFANDSIVVTALEEPHNDIHLSVGGFDFPGVGESGQIPGANGDMGENNTAALDPIFFFHHCNIDRMLWLWQKRHNATKKIEIIEDYAGTSSNDLQGPTQGIAPDTSLGITSPLAPFINPQTNATFTGEDCVDIEGELLNYTYGPGSLDEPLPRATAAKSGFSKKKLTVRGVDRALFQGSFILTAYANVPGADGKTEKILLGHHSALSRWSVIKCANCRTHLEVIAHFSLDGLTEDAVSRATFSVEVSHRGQGVPAGFKPRLVVH